MPMRRWIGTAALVVGAMLITVGLSVLAYEFVFWFGRGVWNSVLVQEALAALSSEVQNLRASGVAAWVLSLPLSLTALMSGGLLALFGTKASDESWSRIPQ